MSDLFRPTLLPAGKTLMLVTDRSQCGGRPLVQVVAAAVDGGVNVVQLREKDLPAGELLVLARQLRGVCGQRARLFINDRLDVALLAGADGVHLGEGSLPASAARQFLPPSMRVGRSVHTINGARQAEAEGADYVLLGTIFASPTHPEVEPAGPELIREVANRVGIPVIVIGGITRENVHECWQAGAAGVAVVSAILRAGDPRAAAEAFARVPEEAADQEVSEEV